MENIKETQDKSDQAYKFLYNFCIDHTKDKEERAEFFSALAYYLVAEIEIEIEKECGK